MLKHLGCKTELCFTAQLPSLQAFDYTVVISGIYNYSYVLPVLSSSANHGRTADIDVLDCLFQSYAILENGLLEGVQVDCHHIDGGDAQLFQLSHVLRVGTHRQNAGMYSRMQGFDTAIQALGEAGHIRNAGYSNTIFLQSACSAACGNYFISQLFQLPGKLNNASFIRNAEQCSLFHIDRPFFQYLIGLLDLSAADHGHSAGKNFPFGLLHYPMLQSLRGIIRENFNGLLHDDLSPIGHFVDKVYRCTGHLNAIGQGCFMHMQSIETISTEGGNQGRMHIDNSSVIRSGKGAAQDTHKACKNDQIDLVFLHQGKQCLVILFRSCIFSAR